MDRTYESGAAGSPPSPPASPSSGYPTAGNPQTATPATKPGPWLYHMLVEEIMSVIEAAGITPSHTDTNQMLDALRLAGVFQTAPKFDTTTKVATTAFVKAAKGGMVGLNSFNASTTLVLDDIGKQIFFYGSTASQTITLPDASTVLLGEGYWITNKASVAVTLKGSGAQNLSINLAGSGQSLSNTALLKPGDSIYVPSNGVSQWNIHGYTSDGQFPSSIGASGYQKLPSGLIIQWGRANSITSSGLDVTLPITFPTACRAVLVSDETGKGGYAGVTAVGVVVTSASVISLTTPSGVTDNAFWLALGH